VASRESRRRADRHDHAGRPPGRQDYRIVVRHGDPEARAQHEKLGFAEGSGSVAGQLAAFAESTASR
jgi:hypothetical protein